MRQADAQNKKGDDDQLKKADKLFEQGKYAEAYPLYTHLLSLHKGNVDITFKYGATLLYGAENKADAIPYLKKAAAKTTTDVRVFYFLGKAYQLNYEFNKAIKAYRDFKSKADDKTLESFDVDQAIRQCENGKNLINEIKEVLVLDKKDVASDDFFRYYELDNLGGKILLAPEEFQTTYDKKQGHVPIIYSAPLSNMVYFSSYGKNGETGLDIYFVTRTGSGSWSDPVKLPAPVNSKYNENYPFFHSDNKSFYFSSDGHNSMGGYDIFRSVFNPSTGSYSTPENLDFAINTPDDDLFYIADSLNQIAYFASARASKQNRLDVYKVKVDLVPSNMIIIKGNFISEIDPSLKKARITIEDESTKRQIAIINTNAKGDYIIDFKSGGQYNFYVEADGNGVVHSGRVEIPRLEYVAAFRQELIMMDDNGTERLMIKNYFDTPLDEETEELMAEILKKRALLEITPADELAEKSIAASSQETEQSFDKLYLSAGFIKTGSNEGILDWIEESTAELQNVNETYKSLAGYAFNQSKVYDEKASQLILQADTKIKVYKYNDDPEKKIEMLKEVVKLRVEAEENLLNASASILLAEQLTQSTQKRKVLIAELQNSKEVIDQAIAEQNTALLNEEITRLSHINEDLKSNEKGLDMPVSYIESIKDIEVGERQLFLNAAEDLREEKNNTLALIRRLETQLNNSTDDEKESISMQLAKANDDLVVLEKQNEAAWEYYRSSDLETKVISKGASLAVEWEGETGSGLPEQAGIDRIALHLDNQQQALNLIIVAEEEALMAIGVSAEELLLAETSTLKTALATQESDDKTTQEPDDKTTIETTVTSTNKEVIIGDELIEDYSIKLNEAQSNQNEIDLLQETILLKQQLLTEVNKQIESTETTYNKTELNSLKSDLSSEIDLLYASFEKALNNQQTGLNDITFYIPDYETKLDEINSADISELEKNNAKSEYLASVVSQLNNNLAGMDLIVVEDGDVLTLRNKTENENALRSIIANVEADMYLINQEMEVQSDIVMDVPPIDELISIAYPDYAYKRALIDNSTAMTANEKATGLIQLNESLMAKLDVQIADLIIEKETALSDEIPVIDAKIAAYTSIKEDKQIEISESISLMVTEDNSTIDEIEITETSDEPVILNVDEKSELIASIDPGFEATYTLLMASSKSEAEKLNEAVNMYEGLSVAVGRKITSLKQDEEMLSDNVETAQIAEEIKSWEALLVEVENEKTDLTNELAVISVVVNETSDVAITEEKERVDSIADETVTEVDVVENPESWNALLTTAKTEAALDLWINKKEISTDPGIENESIKTVAADQSQQIAELNQLNMQLAEYDLKLLSADKKETKKLNKEKAQLMTEIENREIALLVDRIPLLIRESEDRVAENDIDANNKSTVIAYIQKSDAYMLQANALEGPEKLKNLGIAYELSLMALQTAGVTELSAQLAQNAGMAGYYEIVDESDLSYEDKKQFYNENIQRLTVLEVGNNDVMNNLKADGVTESDATWKEHVAISKIYHDAIIWNQQELDELNALQSKIEKDVIAETTGINAPSTGAAFEAAMGDIGLNEAQVAYIKDNPELQTYYAIGWKEHALDLKLKDLQQQRTDYIANAEISRVQAEEAEVVDVNQLSGQEAIVAYENSKKYNTEAIVWYEKVDSLDMVIDILKTQKSTVAANRIAFHERMDEDNKDAVITIETGALLAISEDQFQPEVPDEEADKIEGPIDIVEEPVEGSIDVVEEPVEVIDIASSTTEQPDTQPADISTALKTGFVFEAGISFYSEEVPIPVDPPLPSGVIFKVQIGAFRNPIPVEHFIGLTPLTAEKLDNGITRYSVGIFYDMPTARLAHAQVRSIGYDDAFIVAFLNGERISINRAMEILGTQPQAIPVDVVVDEQTQTPVNTGNDQQNNNNNQNTNIDNRTDTGADLNQNSTSATVDVDGNQNNQLHVGYYNAPNAAPATEVESTKKLFYTVQVGVYSKPVSLGDIYNIQPLNVERTGLGYTRYTSGQFSDILEAETHKEYVVNQGITDAFITAYHLGKRISVERAQTLMLTEPGAVLEEGLSQSFEDPTQIPALDTVIPPMKIDIKSVPDREEIIRNAKAEDLRYVIYLGSYKDDIPNEVAGALLEFSNVGIKRAINQGIIVYSTREMENMYEAEEWLGRFRESGVTEARIIYVVSGEEITLKQAKDILDK
jgi:hypothetical protein